MIKYKTEKMKKITLTCCSIIVLFLFSSYTVKEDNDFYEIAFKTQQTLTNLTESIYSNGDTDLKKSLNSLENSSKQLFKILGDYSETNEINLDYLNGLSNSQKALEKIINKLEDKEKSIHIMNDVTNDYNIKLKSINYGISSNINVKVNVQVRTLKEYGYYAFVKYSYDDEYIKRYEFNNPTNHAERDLAPGYYIIWIEKGDYKSKERKIEITSKSEDNIIYFEE